MADWDARPRVRELDPMDAESFAQETSAQQAPLLLRGQVADWPLVKAGQESTAVFTKQLLRDANSAPVRYFEGNPGMQGRFFYDANLQGFNFERKEASFPEFLERLTEQEDRTDPAYLYAGAIPVPQNAPRLARLQHGLLPTDQEQLVSLWIGNHSRTAAHFDLPQNLACVLRGRRRFILLPTSQLKNLYLGPLERTIAGQAVSLVDFLDPDLDLHPRFAEAFEHALVADLEPGDALYVPSLWFHHVETLDSFGAMMNFWWRDAPAHLFTPMITLMHSLLSIRDLPEVERAAWRTVFDHYIFQVDGDPMAHLPESARGMFGEMTPEKLRRLKHYLGKTLR